MEIRTKFEIGDKVCYLSQSGIVEDEVVIGMEIICHRSRKKEDEDGIPIKYREKIMALSKKTNKAIAKRWDEAIARREAERKKK